MINDILTLRLSLIVFAVDFVIVNKIQRK